MQPSREVHDSKREALRIAQEVKDRNLKMWTDTLKLRFVHIRPVTDVSEPLDYHETLVALPKGGATIAYVLPKHKGGNVLHVAVALVHENDVFCRKTGRYLAAKNFYNGLTTQIRIGKGGWTPATFLKQMFGMMV